MSRIRTALVGTVAAGLLLMSAGTASADVTTKTEFDNIALGNSWWLESPTEITTDVSTTEKSESRDGASLYNSQIRQPINPDNTSTWPAKRGVIPVQFNLTASPTTETATTTTTTTAVTKIPSFQSIGSDSDSNNDWSALTHVPPAGTTVKDIENLSANFAYTDGGESHGGSLRWQINLTNGKAINVYYGETASWTGQSGSGVDLADATDDRIETMALNGVFYNTWEAVKADFGTLEVGSVALTVDSGWQNAPNGDQRINLFSATVNGSTKALQNSYQGAPDIIDPLYPSSTTYPAWVPGPSLVTTTTGAWVPGPAGTPVQTNEPPAFIKVVKVNKDGTPIDTIEQLSSAQGDTDGKFRQIDGKYMYNLKAETLGSGNFYVYMVIDDVQVMNNPGVFELR
jgi:hypothetical protein